MSYPLPSLADLSARARQLFTESIPGAVVSVWPNIYAVTAKVLALVSFEWHQRASWLSRQIFASTADEVWLRRHAFELGISQRPATRAIGDVSIGTTVAGVTIPAGITMTATDGRLYRTRTSFLTTGAAVTVSVEADEAGSAGNLAAATTLAVGTDGYPSLAATATVAPAGIGGGVDAESLEALRARVLFRKRSPPLGGSTTDWTRWALEVPGVAIRAGVPMVFVDRFLNDPRTVWVAFLFDGRPNGIPTSGDVAVVQAYLEDPARRPVTSDVIVVAPTPVAVNITIQNLSPDNVDVRTAVMGELSALFSERMQPATPSTPFVMSRSWIGEAVSRAAGEGRHVLVAPAADVTFTSGQMPVLGTVSFT